MADETGYGGYQGPEQYAGYGSREWRNRIALEMLRRKQDPITSLGGGILSASRNFADYQTMQALDARERARDAGLVRTANSRPLPGMPQAPGMAAVPGAAPAPPPASSLFDQPSGALPQQAADAGQGGLAEQMSRLGVGRNYPFTEASDEPAGPRPQSPLPAQGENVPLPPPRPVYNRNPQNAELEAKPELKQRLLTIARGESGTPAVQKAVLASVFNRAVARGTSMERETQEYTGPESPGYYPSSSFGRGQADPGLLTDVMRGSNEAGQALGFAPTGNASGGVAERGIASGRYGNAGRIGGETFVTQERPEQLARLAATRVPGAPLDIRPQEPSAAVPFITPPGRDAITAAMVPSPAPPSPPVRMAALGGASTTDVAAVPPPARNPIIVRPDIALPPRVAQANGFAGTVPGPMAPMAPEPAPPSVGRTTQMLPQQQGPRPKPPILDLTLTPEEVHGYNLMRANPGDPDYAALAKPYLQYGQQKRQAEFAQKQEQYKADEASWLKEFEMRTTRALDAPKIEADLRKSEVELAEAEQKRQELARRGGVKPDEAFAVIKDSHKDAASIPGEVAAIRNAQRVLPQAVTGFGAEAKVNILRVLAAAGQPVDPSISATQQFQSYVKGVYGRLRPQVIGAGPQANAEGKVLEKAAAGDISMDPAAISAVLNSIYALNVMAANEHQKKVAVYTGPDPKAQQYAYGTFGLPMQDIVPDSAVRLFRQHYKEDPTEAIREFNEDFNTPGLAQKILQSGR